MVAAGVNIPDVTMNDPIVKQMLRFREDHARKQTKDYSHVFRSKSRLDLVRLSCIVVAVELAYAAETAFVSPILLQIGVEHQHMTMVWGLSPFLGFFISPILGSLSDRCRSPIGRRRPLMIGLSVGIILGLILIPYGKTFGTLLGDAGDTILVTNSTSYLDYDMPQMVGPSLSNHIASFVFTILGTILLDFNADTCQTPSRAYLLDVCIPSDHARAMSTFSIMAGLGGTVGYAIGAIDWNSTNVGWFFGGNYQTVFVIVLVVFVVCFSITVTSFREIPLELIESDELLRPLTTITVEKELKRKNNLIYFIKEATAMELKLSNMGMDMPEEDRIRYSYMSDKMNNNNHIVNGMHFDRNGTKSVVLTVPKNEEQVEKITLYTYLKSIVFMPSSMRILSITNLLCHMAHLSYCLYFTDFVGERVFGGDPSAQAGSPPEELYNAGVRFGCWGLSLYALSCSIYAIIIERVLSCTNTRIVYVGGILSFAVGMLILAIWPTKLGVILFSVSAGIMYATLFTMPFILLARYHSNGYFKRSSDESTPLKPPRGLGTDIAIISSMVFIGQLIVSLSMGSMITLIGSTSAILYVASGVAILAAIAAMNVLYLE